MDFKNRFKKNKKAKNTPKHENNTTSTSEEQQPFDEYENLKNRKYSRSARNKNSNKKSVTSLQKALLFLGIVIVLIPIIVFGYYSNQQKLPEKENAEQVMVFKTKNSSADESSKKKQESIESSKKAESSK